MATTSWRNKELWKETRFGKWGKEKTGQTTSGIGMYGAFAHLFGEDSYDKAATILSGFVDIGASHISQLPFEAVHGARKLFAERWGKGGNTFNADLPWKKNANGFNTYSQWAGWKKTAQSGKEALQNFERFAKNPRDFTMLGKALGKTIGTGVSGLARTGLLASKALLTIGVPFALSIGAYAAIRHSPEFARKLNSLEYAKVGGSFKTMRTQREFLQTMQKNQGLYAVNSLMGREAEFYHGIER